MFRFKAPSTEELTLTAAWLCVWEGGDGTEEVASGGEKQDLPIVSKLGTRPAWHLPANQQLPSSGERRRERAGSSRDFESKDTRPGVQKGASPCNSICRRQLG